MGWLHDAKLAGITVGFQGSLSGILNSSWPKVYRGHMLGSNRSHSPGTWPLPNIALLYLGESRNELEHRKGVCNHFFTFSIVCNYWTMSQLIVQQPQPRLLRRRCAVANMRGIFCRLNHGVCFVRRYELERSAIDPHFHCCIRILCQFLIGARYY